MNHRPNRVFAERSPCARCAHAWVGQSSTIGREIHAVEAELVRSGMSRLAIPEVPHDIADLMAQLWQAAVAVQLDDVLALKAQAQAVSEDARQALTESQLRCDVLMQELALLRVAMTERDERLAMPWQRRRPLQSTRHFGRRTQATQLHAEQLVAKTVGAGPNGRRAIASARDRYDGLAKQLMLETSQQRQAAHAESSRLANQPSLPKNVRPPSRNASPTWKRNGKEVRAQRDQAPGRSVRTQICQHGLARPTLDGIMINCRHLRPCQKHLAWPVAVSARQHLVLARLPKEASLSPLS